MADKLVRLSDVSALELKYAENDDIKDGWFGAIDAVMNLPAVDAVEVRHGRWEGNYPQARFRLKRCSACGTLAPEGWYCFFCGAKMDGKEEHNAAD